MTEFTKGKWVYDEPFGVIFSHETCEVIAHVQGAGTGSCFCSTQEGQANARLIAAAPEMFEAITECADTLEAIKFRDDCKEAADFYQLEELIHALWELLTRIDGKEENTAHEETE